MSPSSVNAHITQRDPGQSLTTSGDIPHAVTQDSR
jgi:hypothetical protein